MSASKAVRDSPQPSGQPRAELRGGGEKARTPRRRATTIVVGCLLVYLLVSAAVFWPAAPWDGSRIASGGYGDAGQFAWFLAWVPFAISHGIDLFRTNYIDYPGGVDLANNPLSPLLGLLAAPTTLSLGPIASFNLFARLAFATSAGSMFLVLRTQCRWQLAFLGGLLYGFGPYTIGQGYVGSHLDLAFVPLPPVILWCVFDLVVTRRHRPARLGAVLGVLAAAQALIDPEILGLLVVIVTVGLAGSAVVDRRHLATRFANLGRAVPTALAAFLILDGYFLWWMLLAPRHLVGPVQAVDYLQLYRSDLLTAVVPTSNEAIAPAALAQRAAGFIAGNFTENTGYLGAPLIASVAGLAVVFRKERVVLVSALLALVAYILSLGSPLTVDGHATSIWLPEALLTHVPLVSSTVPARFSLCVLLLSVVALTVGADRLVTRLTRPGGAHRRRWSLATLLAGAVVMAAVFPRLPLATSPLPWPPDTEAVLDAVPQGAVVLAYPFPLSRWTGAMFWQAADRMRFRLIGGYATVQGPDGAGVERPPLLPPDFVQQFLVAEQSGVGSFYGAPPTVAAPTRALCRFLASYEVGAVVFWDEGVDPAPVRQLFSSALGSAAATSRDGTLLVWVTGDDRCR